jgi:hypothetical protein
VNLPLAHTHDASDMPLNARAAVVNRTHRVVREQALQMQQSRERNRSLWIPFGIFSIVLPVICYAVWFMMDGYDITQKGIPDASGQIFVLLLWSLPVTALFVAMAWVKRSHGERGGR